MKKIGIFVEGETEMDFVSKLLEEIAGQNNLTIIQVSWRWSKHRWH